MTQDQTDFIDALRSISKELADYIRQQMAAGATFDSVQAQLRNAVRLVDSWRIGRGV